MMEGKYIFLFKILSALPTNILRNDMLRGTMLVEGPHMIRIDIGRKRRHEWIYQTALRSTSAHTTRLRYIPAEFREEPQGCCKLSVKHPGKLSVRYFK